MIELTDSELEKAAKELTPNPNCCVIRQQHLAWQDRPRCEGRLKIIDGKIRILDSCNEPCSFICDTARKFDNNVEMVRAVIRVINLIKTSTQ